jgi:hypothetical protein
MAHRGEFGAMAALRANKIISIPLKEAIARNRTVGDDMIEVADGLLDIVADKATVGT